MVCYLRQSVGRHIGVRYSCPAPRTSLRLGHGAGVQELPQNLRLDSRGFTVRGVDQPGSAGNQFTPPWSSSLYPPLAPCTLLYTLFPFSPLSPGDPGEA
eukprot:6572140-Pyramimonas_sp.AAC.1